MALIGEKYAKRVPSAQPTIMEIEVGFTIVQATDENDAINALNTFAPATWTLQGTVCPKMGAKLEPTSDTSFDATVHYSTGNIDNALSFDTTGGRAKIEQSLGTTGYPNPAIGIAPDFYGLIGVTKSSVEGVELTMPALSFAFRKTFPAASVTPSYVKTLAGLTGNYNNAVFATFPAGEVRFDGAQGDQKYPTANVDILFKFTTSPNSPPGGLTVAGISGINKLGWQYLWVLWEEQEDSAASFLVKRPIAVYVEDLPNLQPVDFSQIGIGVLSDADFAKLREQFVERVQRATDGEP
jgi:hypothetical protein